MRNRWYVAGLAGAAMLCSWGTVHAALGSAPLMAMFPGALALALFGAAAWAAVTGSFAPPVKPVWSEARPPAVTRWLKDRADRADAASKPRTAAPAFGAKSRS